MLWEKMKDYKGSISKDGSKGIISFFAVKD